MELRADLAPMGYEQRLSPPDPSRRSKAGGVGRVSPIDCVWLTALLAIGCSAGPLRPTPEPGAPAPTYFIAPNGNDLWSGELPAPNATNTDGPFATLERARDEIRTLRRTRQPSRHGVTIALRAGRYQRDRPFVLTSDDSGRAGAPIIYRTYRDEEVRIDGGHLVRAFEVVTAPAVLARLDPAARGRVLQADLRAQGITEYGTIDDDGLEVFHADEPMTLARWPNGGFAHLVGLLGVEPIDDRGTKGDRVGAFLYEGDRPRRWAEDYDIWLHGYWFWDWADGRQRIASVDTTRRLISLEPPHHHYGYRVGQWYYAFNLLSELDQPGEWYLDRLDGLLYFWPPARPGLTNVSISPGLVSLHDASYIAFQGLVFESTRGTAISVSGGTHVEFEDCTIRNARGWALRIRGGTAHGVSNCEITGTGQGGIWLEGGDRVTLTPGGHYVQGSHVHHYSRWKRTAQAAIEIAGVGNRATNNLIHDAPNMAIALFGNEHVIERNEIHHVCLETNDAGAIYAGRDWTMRGTTIRHNYFHHLSGFENRGCNGVLLDDMFSGTEVHGNVFHAVARGVLIGGGRDNVVTNNVFVDCGTAITIDARGEGWAAAMVNGVLRSRLEALPYRRPPWTSRYPALASILEDEPAAPTGNVVARNISWRGRWLNVAPSAGARTRFVANTVDVDPRFVDPARQDFRLKRHSPAISLGFEPIPMEKIGRRGAARAPPR